MTASDDLTKPSTIEKEVDFLENNLEYGLVVGNDEIIDSNGNTCYWMNEQREVTYDLSEAKYKTFVDFLRPSLNYFDNDNFGTYKTLSRWNYIPNGYLIRKILFDNYINFPNERILEDWFIMMQLSKYSKFKYIDEI